MIEKILWREVELEGEAEDGSSVYIRTTIDDMISHIISQLSSKELKQLIEYLQSEI